MSFCSPSESETERLLAILAAYDRDEVLLRASQIFALELQPVQVAFDAIEPDGTVLRDTAGVIRNHTLQVFSDDVQMVPGQRLHLSRQLDGVRLQILPFGQDYLAPGDNATDTMHFPL